METKNNKNVHSLYDAINQGYYALAAKYKTDKNYCLLDRR